MKRFLAIAVALVMAFAMAACSSTPPTDEPANGTAAPVENTGNAIAAGDLKIGVILVHDENSGYDLAHIEGVEGAMVVAIQRRDQVAAREGAVARAQVEPRISA